MILTLTYPWNLNNPCLFFPWLLFFRMSTLKSPIMMIGQCSKKCWIIIWSLFSRNWTWMNFMHTYNMYFFCVLILNDVIYYEPSLVIVLKESKCMYMSYIIINPWPSWIEIFEYLDEFINLCTYIDVWCIFVSIKHNIWNVWGLWSWLCFHNVGVKKLYSNYK